MQAQPGQPNPLGATLMREGVNFSVYARGAESLSLRLFEHADDAEPSHTFTLNPQAHRHHHYWHVWVPGLRAGQLYGWCADGPHEPARGMRVQIGQSRRNARDLRVSADASTPRWPTSRSQE